MCLWCGTRSDGNAACEDCARRLPTLRKRARDAYNAEAGSLRRQITITTTPGWD